MNRKIRRHLEKKMGKEPTKDLAAKISQFNELPDQCSACQKEFDKKDKSMVQSWNVVVKQEAVRIFCPECIKKTQEILDERK
tara:strand:+ start:123 stop:368 length:246 start_codon:yes stop_codon:yes gene_type:complete